MFPLDVLARLRCPACHGALVASATEADTRTETGTGTGTGTETIHCESCRRVFPVRDGIPVLIVGESSPRKAN